MRRRSAVLASAGLSCLLAAAAPTATAAIVEPTPAEGAVVGAHAELRFTSDSRNLVGQPDAVMRIDGPGEFAAAGTPNEQGFSSVVLDTRCPGEPCGQPVPNGPYVVVEDRIGDQDATRRFSVRIGGLPVPEVTGTLEGRTVTVRWKPGPEADVTGWQVADDQGTVKTVPAPRNEAGALACPEAGCSVAFEYPPSVGGTRTFAVRAARPCGDEGCPDVLGPAATSAGVEVPGPPVPAATAAPSPSGGGSASSAPPRTGGSGSSGSARGFGGFAPKLGLPKLPPLPNSGAPAVAAPEVADTFDETHDYGDRELPEVADDDQPRSAGREGTRLTATGGLLQDEQVVRGVAAALVLGMSGAHLRTWLARTREEDLEL